MCIKSISVVVAVLNFATLACSSSAVAQPSGGPYGPTQKAYEAPGDAKHIYYVAPDGKPAAGGTTADTPTTLEVAIKSATTSDAIILRGGVYRTGNLRLNQGITLQPYKDERPILKGTLVATEWESLQDGLWRTKWQPLFPATLRIGGGANAKPHEHRSTSSTTIWSSSTESC